MRPLVSIVVPCFNAARWIEEALESAVEQVSALDLIVVDDGSTDGTADIVKARFPSARLTVTGNRGASAARNLGTEQARGAFIQYLDADDLLAPGKIRAQLDALDATGADVAYGAWKRISSDVPAKELEVVSRAMERAPELELVGGFWCPPAAYLFRRRIVEQVGRWNETLPVIQDARFALDCALHGGRFVFTAGLMASYRVHADASLSRRDPAAFTRDVHTNARQVEAWWREHGGLTEDRRAALVACFAHVARVSRESDPDTSNAAIDDVERLAGGQVPGGSLPVKVVATLVGYRHAEAAAARYRRARRAFRSLHG